MTMLKSLPDMATNDASSKYASEIPIEIDISKIFENVVTIKALRFAPKNAIIGVDVPLNHKVYSIIGRVKEVRIVGRFFETSIEVDFIPQEMMKDIEEIVNKVYY